ncbi:Uncharacterised protein [Mycobacterium tuberculosis]|uniref:Uncharacterized protein n=1 Tax=Mycobacterium tuberculosis TaxID=1773 RepID=A0A0U0RYI0_MYCTX|nr:Uncharacterised protein [Mycobacterium tuberculosis]COY44424.1 Uncharacterised protein [Mycobacterium tuberculosis]
MCWHISSLVTTRSGRYAPTLSSPTLLAPLVVAISVIPVLSVLVECAPTATTRRRSPP